MAEQRFERHKNAAYRLQSIQQCRKATETAYPIRDVIQDHLVYVELNLIGGVSKYAPIDPHDIRRCALLGFLWHCVNWDERDGGHENPKAHFDVQAAKDCANIKECGTVVNLGLIMQTIYRLQTIDRYRLLKDHLLSG
jgi:hypothetical protein